MKDFIEAIDIDMWDIVELEYEVPKIMPDRIFQPKSKSLQKKEEKKKHLLASKVNGLLLTHPLQMNMNLFPIVQQPKKFKMPWKLHTLAYHK